MKKNTIILLIGAALGIFAYRYFLKGGSKNNISIPGINQDINKVTATYIGPELTYMGLVTKTGDMISGTINEDGSLNYKMAGNGIVASNKLFIIPSNQYVTEMQ